MKPLEVPLQKSIKPVFNFNRIVPFHSIFICVKGFSSTLQSVSKKTEQIGNHSQICKPAGVMKFLVQVDYFGTYDVE